MDYNLCKELKDAGFPGSDTWKDYGDFWAPNIGKGQEVVPTLSKEMVGGEILPTAP
jgi:hypothetical protein